MSFKVVRNQSGAVVAYGPNEDFYEPSLPYTIEEAEPTIAVGPKELLAKLDADNALTQRNLRETVMLMAEAFKVVSNNAVDLSTIPGVAKVYDVEQEAAALRAQL